MFRTVDVTAKFTPRFAEFADAGQRKHLESAAVGQHRAIETVELVETAGRFEHFKSGTQIEMIGVAENDLGFYFIIKLMDVHALDGTEGAHGHEDGRLYGAVVGSQETGARITAGIGVLQLEKSAFGAPSGAE